MGAFVSLIIVLFGIVWTVAAISVGGWFFAVFGVLFVLAAIGLTVYNFKNATSENRYSGYDIAEDDEEVDPLNVRYGSQDRYDMSTVRQRLSSSMNTSEYCPYCGNPVSEEYEFCNNCGRRLP